MKLGDLTPHPGNPRKISEQELASLGKSLEAFGPLDGIVYNRKFKRLVGAHQRQKRIPADSEIVIEQRFDPPTKTGTTALGYCLWNGERWPFREVHWEETIETAAMIAANQHGGDFDSGLLAQRLIELDHHNFDLTLTGFEMPEIENICAPLGGIHVNEHERGPAGSAEEDEVPEPPKIAKTARGELWTLGNHRLLIGDSTKLEDVERLMGGAKADMVFTDPPYNVDYDYNFSDDDRTNEEYLEFISNAFLLCSGTVLKDNATMYVKNAPRNLPDFFPIIKSLLWELNNLIVWPHSCQFHPQNRFSTNWEAICAFTRGKPTFNPKAQVQEVDTPLRLKGLKKLDGRIDDVWHDIPWLSAGAMMSKETIRKGETNSKAHPCQMPMALAIRGIVFSSNDGDSVYDPFSGSGTVLMSCEKAGRKGFGIEIDPAYCDLILDRFKKHAEKDPVREDGVPWSSLRDSTDAR